MSINIFQKIEQRGSEIKMRIKRESRMSWQEAPDIISPEDLSNITGIGIQFDSPDFPSINKSIIGNTGKADKEAVRLYLQGIKFKNNDKNVLLAMIYKELRQINLYIEESKVL